MRLTLLVILLLEFFGCHAQNDLAKVFKTTEYINGKLYRQTTDTLMVTKERIDFYFLNSHFDALSHLPEKFFDLQHRSQKISVWALPNANKDYRHNWENTYTYDSIGRLTNYTYSSCYICSSLPYNNTVTYNSLGQVEQIADTTNDRNKAIFQYNKQGDIIKVEIYYLYILEKTITMEN